MKLTKGFKPIREKVVKSARYMRACDNCKYFYQTPEDEEEVCQNSNVLEYDICVDGNRVYCTFWKGIGTNESK